MKKISVRAVADAVAELCLRANLEADAGVLKKLKTLAACPDNGETPELLLANAAAARGDRVPICQDTGMVVVFLDLGQDVALVGGDLEEAVQAGVRAAYRDGVLRASVVSDPLEGRVNTSDNTPAVIHTRIVPGSGLRLTVAPKGFGSENASALAMLTPARGREGVVEFVLRTIREKGAAACPPLVLGIGIGGTLEKAALLAKQALTLPLGRPHPKPFYRLLENEILAKVNALGIGMQGLGKGPTALAVHILEYPTHIAGLPVALNTCCHVYRHASAVIEGKG